MGVEHMVALLSVGLSPGACVHYHYIKRPYCPNPAFFEEMPSAKKTNTMARYVSAAGAKSDARGPSHTWDPSDEQGVNPSFGKPKARLESQMP